MAISHFSIYKTNKNINDIINVIEDRLIITKDGKLYFDYSATDRIEINTSVLPYICSEKFINLQESIIVNYDTLTTYDNLEINEVSLNNFVVDTYGSIGIITKKNDKTKKCSIYIISLINNIKLDFDTTLNNQIVGDLNFTQNENAVTLNIKKINILEQVTETNEVIFTSLNNALDVKYVHENKALEFEIKTSNKDNNIFKIVEDGIYVESTNLSDYYTINEIDAMFQNLKFGIGETGNNLMKYMGPYATICNIPQPYLDGILYLVGALPPYDVYVKVGKNLLQIGIIDGFINIEGNDSFYTKNEINEYFYDKNEILDLIKTIVLEGGDYYTKEQIDSFLAVERVDQ